MLRANPALLELLGDTADEFAGLTQYDFLGHDRADVNRRVAEVVRRGRAPLERATAAVIGLSARAAGG